MTTLISVILNCEGDGFEDYRTLNSLLENKNPEVEFFISYKNFKVKEALEPLIFANSNCHFVNTSDYDFTGSLLKIASKSNGKYIYIADNEVEYKANFLKEILQKIQNKSEKSETSGNKQSVYLIQSKKVFSGRVVKAHFAEGNLLGGQNITYTNLVSPKILKPYSFKSEIFTNQTKLFNFLIPKEDFLKVRITSELEIQTLKILRDIEIENPKINYRIIESEYLIPNNDFYDIEKFKERERASLNFLKTIKSNLPPSSDLNKNLQLAIKNIQLELSNILFRKIKQKWLMLIIRISLGIR